MAYAHAQTHSDRGSSFFALLRDRPELQLAAGYVGGAWLLYDVADLVVFAFGLPEALLRALLGLLAAGAVLTLIVGHWLRLTVRAGEEAARAPDEDVRGVPDFLEPALRRVAESVSRRTTLLVMIGSTTFFFFLFLFLWNSWAAAHERQVVDPRITLAVFPFGEASADGPALGGGFADMLAITLDGTPGIRVIDPEAAWPLPATNVGGQPRVPSLSEARSVSERLGATRFVTGELVRSGSRVEIGTRVHDRADGGDDVSVRLSAHEDSLGAALSQLAIAVVAEVWEREQVPTVPMIDRAATGSAEALKAYLEAKSALRSGHIEEARGAIERATAEDSTFALAHLERFAVESWIQFGRAQPFSGLRPMIEAAARHSERLTPRNRMRIDAHLALDRTDAAAAAFLFERILAIDSLDVGALQGLAYAELVGGWQFGRGIEAIVRSYGRVLRADSTNTGALATLARLGMWNEDLDRAGASIERITRVDSLGPYARGTIGAFEILSADAGRQDSLLASWAADEVPVVTTVLRDLRTSRPDLLERFLEQLVADSMATYHRSLGLGGRAQLLMAQGRVVLVDSLVRSGELASLRIPLAAFQIAATLAGVGDPDLAARWAAELAELTPVDSLERLLESQDVWITGWSVGAYHATFGDTVEARRWARALGALPAGETTVPEWPAALEADIEARLAVRRGDRTEAERLARAAYEAWSIHSSAALEHQPEPAMRFHLARLLGDRGASAQAEPLLRSLTPPHTWLGFYTARAHLELGRMREQAGDATDAARHYRNAIRLWESGEERVVGAWLAEAREGLGRSEPASGSADSS